MLKNALTSQNKGLKMQFLLVTENESVEMIESLVDCQKTALTVFT